MDIEQVELATATLAAVRERVRMDALPAFYDRAFRQVAEALGAAGVTPLGPAVGWFADAPTDTIDIAVGFPAPPSAVLDGVELLTVPGGPAVVGTYQGSYDRMADAWGEVAAWCREQDVQGRGDFWEEYVTEPSPGGDPEQNVTRLVSPLL
ncbi:GyrI-like domain-containing protein [Cellulomonas palmilytica]|uniref:GyrI-like domain-containing protein n=1 Tax=Cellulomonas palmilytica TaxID=2608402 RepID=UPI001F1E7512|nr:GyrI-like domain-containing protein [Cellulomonas palmilytica]UJP38560.1 GyrI-like domain-containing protein [Cellulomonas palmilytica]